MSGKGNLPPESHIFELKARELRTLHDLLQTRALKVLEELRANDLAPDLHGQPLFPEDRLTPSDGTILSFIASDRILTDLQLKVAQNTTLASMIAHKKQSIARMIDECRETQANTLAHLKQLTTDQVGQRRAELDKSQNELQEDIAQISNLKTSAELFAQRLSDLEAEKKTLEAEVAIMRNKDVQEDKLRNINGALSLMERQVQEATDVNRHLKESIKRLRETEALLSASSAGQQSPTDYEMNLEDVLKKIFVRYSLTEELIKPDRENSPTSGVRAGAESESESPLDIGLSIRGFLSFMRNFKLLCNECSHMDACRAFEEILGDSHSDLLNFEQFCELLTSVLQLRRPDLSSPLELFEYFASTCSGHIAHHILENENENSVEDDGEEKVGGSVDVPHNSNFEEIGENEIIEDAWDIELVNVFAHREYDLKRLYSRYTERGSVGGGGGDRGSTSPAASGDDSAGNSSCMDFDSFFEFCCDYSIFPGLMSKQGLLKIFHQSSSEVPAQQMHGCDSPATVTSISFPDLDREFLSFADWLEAISRIALDRFARQPYSEGDHQLSTADKVSDLLQFIEDVERKKGTGSIVLNA